MQKDTKKRMERELYQYYNNKKLLDKLKKEIKNIPTRKFLYLEQRIGYVDNVISMLNDFEKQTFKIIFHDRADCMFCQTHQNISKSTYYNIINKCILLLAKEWRRIINRSYGVYRIICVKFKNKPSYDKIEMS